LEVNIFFGALLNWQKPKTGKCLGAKEAPRTFTGLFFICDVERDKVNSLLFTLRAEELIQVQYLGYLFRNNS